MKEWLAVTIVYPDCTFDRVKVWGCLGPQLHGPSQGRTLTYLRASCRYFRDVVDRMTTSLEVRQSAPPPGGGGSVQSVAAGEGALSVLPPGGGGVVISALPAGLLARLPNLIRIDFSGRDEGTRAACTPVLVASLGPLATALLAGSLRDVAFRGTQVTSREARKIHTCVATCSIWLQGNANPVGWSLINK